MHKYISALLLFILFTAKAVFAQENLVTLQEAVQTGLENNFGILFSRNEQRVAENNAEYAKFAFFPVLDATGQHTWTREDITQEFVSSGGLTESNFTPNAQSNVFQYGLNATWTIFDGFGMFIGYEQLQKLKEAGELDVRVTVENTAADIASAYYLVISEEATLEVLKENLNLSRERMDLTYYQYEVGRSSKQQYLQAQVDFNADSSALLDQSVALRAARIELSRLMGLPPTSDLSVKDSIIFKEELPLNDLEYYLLSNNPQYLLARQNEQLARIAKRSITAERYPTIDLIASYDHFENEAEGGFFRGSETNGYTYGARASVNVFNRFDLRRREQNAEIAIKSTEIQREQLEQQLLANLRTAFLNYEVSRERLALEKRNLELARENAEIALDRYKLGNATNLELREAQVNAVQAESRTIEAAFNAKLNEIELKRLTGTIL